MIKYILKSRKDILGFDDRLLMLKGVPIISILTNLLFFGEMLKEGHYFDFIQCLFIALVYSSAYWAILREVHFYYAQRYNNYDDTKERIVKTIFTMLVIYFLLFYIGKFMMIKIIAPHINHFVLPHPLIEIISTITFSLMILTVYEAMYTMNKLKKILVEKESLEKANIRSQLMGLRSQINPHFLFNSLNTLTSLIHKDADRAENFATKLSKVYRYMLEHRNDKLTHLTEEMSWLESYIHLLKERFGDNLHIELNIDQSIMDKSILPLCLQITFENAIKHNVITSEKPLTVRLYSQGNYLCIENNLQKKHSVSSSTKFGLENIKRRYKFFTNMEVKVEESESHFSVFLPLLTPQNFVDESA